MKASSCTRVRARLSDYLDDRLHSAAARAVSLHLAVCDDCRTERDALEALSFAVAALPFDAPARGLADRVRHGRRPAIWPTAVAAGLLLSGGVAGGYALGVQSGERTVPAAREIAREVKETRPQQEVESPAADVERPVPVVVADGPPTDHTLPTDGLALRAARSVFADLDLLDEIPIDLHEQIMRPQFDRYDLVRWAEVRRGDPMLHPLANLIQDLDRSLAGGLEPHELASLRGNAARLSGFIEDLGHTLLPGEATSSAFSDPGGIYDRLEWTEDEDGVRHGFLDVERRTSNGVSVVRIEVRSSGGRRREDR